MLLHKTCVSNVLKILPFPPILILSKINPSKWVSSIGFFRLLTCIRGQNAMTSVLIWKKNFFLPCDWKFSSESSFLYTHQNFGQVNEHTVFIIIKFLMLNKNCQHIQYSTVQHYF